MANEKILVVEDESITAMEIEDRLKMMGYVVTAAVPTGEEAIQKAGETQPDIVMMDINLIGDMDGIEAARQIKERYGIPVVYLTAYSDKETLERAKITEPFGYMLKPFEERDIQITIAIGLYKKRIENKLKESEEWLATTIGSIADGVIATDKNGIVKFMNPVAYKLLGLTQEETVNKPLREVFNVIIEETGEQYEISETKMLNESVKFGQKINTILIDKNGNKIPIDTNSAPIKDDKGLVSGTVLVFHDMTERKQIEDELRQSKESVEKYNQELNESNEQMEMMSKWVCEMGAAAEATNNIKDDFLANVSNEIMTPLTAILGMTDELINSEITQEQRVTMENIRKSGNSILELVNDMIELSKLDVKQLKLKEVEFDLPELVEKIVDTLDYKAQKKGLELSYDITSQVQDMAFKGDPLRLQQILVNLLDNAIENTENGEVQLMVENSLPSSPNELDIPDNVNTNEGKIKLQFNIKDTGKGISEEDQTKIYDMLSEPNVLTTENYDHKDFGLGLIISKSIIELMDGKIWYESEPGSGCNFHFTANFQSSNKKSDNFP